MKKALFLSAVSALVLCFTAGAIPAFAAPASYNSYINVATQGSGLLIEPTLVYEPSGEDGLDGTGYASVIVTPDAEMKVDLGTERTLQDFFNRNLKGKSIPVIRLTAETVDPFLGWLSDTYTILDIMAVSDDIAVLEKIYADEKGYLVNTVYDLTDAELSADRYAQWENIAAANKAGCNILMYDVRENLNVVAEYVSAMSKVCWAVAETEEEAVRAISVGCYGVVSADKAVLGGSLGYFEKKGFARAQYIAAHRGITKYANEQSLTGVMASYNEGATHVEIDIQITSDGHLVSCHNSDTGYVTKNTHNGYIIKETLASLKKVKLSNFSERYMESFATLDDICEAMQKTDVILIVELKLDSASKTAVEDLKAIETLKNTMEKYPGMKGHWITITFFSPYAKGMKELIPEVPCCFLGAGISTMESQEGKKAWDGENKSMLDLRGKIEFLRKRNIGLDETMADTTNTTAQNYLARGYVQNTWTFEDLSHFGYKANIATTNKAEDCAMLIKEVAINDVTLTREQLASGKATVACRTYNGWVTDCACDVIEVSRTGDTAQVLFYYLQKVEGSTYEYGLYSELKTVAIQ